MYKNKYLKYKNKYIDLKNELDFKGGASFEVVMGSLGLLAAFFYIYTSNNSNNSDSNCFISDPMIEINKINLGDTVDFSNAVYKTQEFHNKAFDILINKTNELNIDINKLILNTQDISLNKFPVRSLSLLFINNIYYMCVGTLFNKIRIIAKYENNKWINIYNEYKKPIDPDNIKTVLNIVDIKNIQIYYTNKDFEKCFSNYMIKIKIQFLRLLHDKNIILFNKMLNIIKLIDKELYNVVVSELSPLMKSEVKSK